MCQIESSYTRNIVNRETVRAYEESFVDACIIMRRAYLFFVGKFL